MPGIATQGVLQSVLLKPTGDPEVPYQIVDGDRRVASAIKYGIKEVPALITDGSRGQIAAMSAILNASRGPNLIDEARSWQTALEEGQFLSVKDLAKHVHVSETTIKARLKLMELPENVLEHVGISIAPGVAMALARLDKSYRDEAVRAVELKLDEGKKFTAADLKAVSIRRVSDRSELLEGLFEQQEEPLLVINPLDELAAEVKRLAGIQGIAITELIARLQEDAPEEVTPLYSSELNQEEKAVQQSLNLDELLCGDTTEVEITEAIRDDGSEELDLSQLLEGKPESTKPESAEAKPPAAHTQGGGLRFRPLQRYA